MVATFEPTPPLLPVLVSPVGVRTFETGTLVYTAAPLPIGTPTVTDWCARGKSWFLSQFGDKPILCDLLCSILDEVQEAEQAVADVRDVRSLALAFGQQLDDIGLLLGHRREGQTDTQYRLELTAVAGVRLDDSSINAVARVFIDLLGAPLVAILEDFPAAYRVFADNSLTYELGQRFARIGRLAKPAAVRYDLNYVPTGFAIMSFSDDTIHPAVPFAERGVPSTIRMAERDSGA